MTVSVSDEQNCSGLVDAHREPHVCCGVHGVPRRVVVVARLGWYSRWRRSQRVAVSTSISTDRESTHVMSDAENISRREQLRALTRVVKYRPRLIIAIIAGGVFAALLEGVGLGFILPIVEIVQSSGNPAQQADGILGAFVSIYQLLGIPFTLGFVVIGVSAILTVRWTLTFVVRWLRSAFTADYTRELQTCAFDNAVDARIEYFDREGSDNILNAIVTQAGHAGQIITFVINFFEQGFLALMYLAVALVVSPFLTLLHSSFSVALQCCSGMA